MCILEVYILRSSNHLSTFTAITSSTLNPFLISIKDILNSILLETSKIVSQSKLNQKKSKNNYIHEGIKCNNCGAFPIVGIRYKCLECDNFNCCEKCEQEQSHPHLFYKIKKDKALKY